MGNMFSESFSNFCEPKLQINCGTDKSNKKLALSINDGTNNTDEKIGDNLLYGENVADQVHNISDGAYENNNKSPELIDFEELIDVANKPSDLTNYRPNVELLKTENYLTTSASNDVIFNEIEDILKRDFTTSILDEVVDLEKLEYDINNIKSIKKNDSETAEAKRNSIAKTDNNLEHSFHFPSIFNDEKDLFTIADSHGSKSPSEPEDIKSNYTSILTELLHDCTHDDDGYNSSDFEFITEDEAKMEGIILNSDKNDERKLISAKNHNSSYVNKHKDRLDTATLCIKNEDIAIEIDSREAPRILNVQDYRDFNGNYRDCHIIPEGDDYIDLFQGPNNMMLPFSDIILLENKSTKPSAMNLQYEGFGFNDQLVRQLDSSEEEYENEAKESVEKILFLYPDENRIRGRTFYH